MKALLLGTFDGVHIGHRELVRQATLDETSVAFTFTAPPAAFFHPGITLLTTPEEKKALLTGLGVTEVICRPFDETVAQIPAQEFVRRLCCEFHPDRIILGFNHRFGAHAAGDGALLAAMAHENGYSLTVVPPVLYRGGAVSSTRIRAEIAAGRMEEAAAMLGREYSLSGIVAPGRGLGHTIGFATANLLPPEGKLLPPDGVYITLCGMEGRTYKAITNIGTNPTVEGKTRTVESHLLGTAGEKYGKALTVRFVRYLREEVRFGALEELKKQLESDTRAADAFLACYHEKGV